MPMLRFVSMASLGVGRHMRHQVVHLLLWRWLRMIIYDFMAMEDDELLGDELQTYHPMEEEDNNAHGDA
ncbi:hypothetical protein F2Q69_00053488 [Brassica cretica]|uniref:Uncharacterized protein n=1 Tax=Brassica cretica TaxID=69181 RepID=A0A8S9N2P3_BRACR|nr:hypothetical protein F2Q69_00053488 [Brassica cretica]